MSGGVTVPAAPQGASAGVTGLPSCRRRPAAWFSPRQLAASDRAHRPARRARALGDVLDVAVPAGLLLGGLGARLAGPDAGRSWVAGVVALVVVGEVAVWPLRAVLDARVELGPLGPGAAGRGGEAPSVSAFAVCFVALALVRLVVSTAVAVGAVAVVRWSPRWPLWLAGMVGLAAAVQGLVQARAGGRLVAAGGARPASPEVAARLAALAGAAGLAPSAATSVWVASERRSVGEGARLVGLGRRRRLVLDRELAAGRQDDLDVVIAHELGHRRHHDASAGLVRGVVAVAVVLVAVRAVLGWSGVDPADPSSFPALWLGVALAAVPARLVSSAAARRDELGADRVAAELVPGGSEQVADHLRRHLLGTGADLRPGRWDRLVGSHPAPMARLDALVPAIAVAPEGER